MGISSIAASHSSLAQNDNGKGCDYLPQHGRRGGALLLAWITEHLGHVQCVNQHIQANINWAGMHLGVLLSVEMSNTVMVSNPLANAMEYIGRALQANF
ncbi:hypothetical protein ACA910_003224 [Epithemia clementina (nom. ined.)]